MTNMHLYVEPNPYDMPLLPYEEAANDPWGIAPSLSCKGTISQILRKHPAGLMGAHILAHDPKTSLNTQVAFCLRYHGNKVPVALWDVECNGILYRHYRGRIYTKRVGFEK